MSWPRIAAALMAVALALAGPSPRASAAAVPQAVGSGFLAASSGPGGVNFSVSVDGQQPPYFELWDYGSDPPRALTLAQINEVKCLGEMFGGQTVQLTGSSVDSSIPGETLRMQVYLVDGGAAGPDRMSVKVQRSDGRVVYFTPMRDLDSGELSVTCSG
jgi:hypothetical protein